MTSPVYAYAQPITVSNSVNLPPIGAKVLLNNLCDAIWVGTAGTVQLVQADGTVVAVLVATVPQIIPIRALRVNATGTTAAALLALYL